MVRRSSPQPSSGCPRSAMSNYPQPPPSYSPTKPAYGSTEDNREPLLGGRFSPEPGPSAGGIYNQPRLGDVPDDFKVSCRTCPFGYSSAYKLNGVQYGVSVSESSLEIRNAFVRKVYTILCAFSPFPAGNRTMQVTNPPVSLSSRTNRKRPLFCIAQPDIDLTFAGTPSSPQPLLAVCSRNPRPQFSGFKPSAFPLRIALYYCDINSTQPVVVLHAYVRCLRQPRPALLEAPSTPAQSPPPIHFHTPGGFHPWYFVCLC